MSPAPALNHEVPTGCLLPPALSLQCSDLVDVHPVHCGGDAVCGALLPGLRCLPWPTVSDSIWLLGVVGAVADAALFLSGPCGQLVVVDTFTPPRPLQSCFTALPHTPHLDTTYSYNSPIDSPDTILAIIFTAVYSADVLLNFFVAFYDNGELITDLRSIAAHYAEWRLWVDLVRGWWLVVAVGSG